MNRYLLVFLILLSSQFVGAQKIDTTFIQLDDIKLHTVVSIPEEKVEAMAIIIAGSGSTDLNGNNLAAGLNTNCYQYLADELVKNKIAVVRYDKRGAGGSVVVNLKEEELSIDSYVQDLEGIIKYCRTHFKQKIYLIGHSEGSLVGLIAAHKTTIDGFISIAGAGNSLDVVLKKQLKPKLPVHMYNQVELLMDSLKNGLLVKNYPPELAHFFRSSVQPYLISMFRYHPDQLLSSLPYETLVVQGNKDIQVDVAEAQKLAQSEKSELLIIENMNHLLKVIEGGMPMNIASYSNPELPVSKDLVRGIVDFINKN